jgi:hypothetical protein
MIDVAIRENPRTSRRGPASRQLLTVSRAMKRPSSIGDVIDLLGAEGLGLALLVLTLPSLIPVPGPFGMVFGTLVGLLALQILIGAERLWLPPRWRARPAPHKVIRTTIAKALPWIGRAERVLRENRMKRFTGRQARIAFAAPILLMAITLALPIPLGNFAPALALIAIGLGFLARDGLAVLIGLVASVGAIGWTAVLFVFGAEALAWATGLLG